MALTQVRMKLGESWTVLTYNEATGRYEGSLTAPGTSASRPGGYYPLTVEVTNQSGESSSLSGEQYRPLRLVVRETDVPAVELVSPPQGWITTSSPVVVFSAADEAGGSGIDPDSVQAAVDGVCVPAAVTESNGEYTITLRPEGLSEGPHLVTVTVSDRDGNETAAGAAYQVDTVPPELRLTAPDSHRVVDRESVEVAGMVWDGMSGVAGVTVDGKAAAVDGGVFSKTVPLEVGMNEINVTAVDAAGLTTTRTVWMLRLITDRTQADVDAVKALAGLSWDNFTAEEKIFWAGIIRGAYNNTDMNRVGTAQEYLTGWLLQYGYLPITAPKLDWTQDDAPEVSELDTFLSGTASIAAQLPFVEEDLPPDMAGLTFGGANAIEAALVAVDAVRPLMDKSFIYFGEGFAGEF